jgi:hypothetical protein
MFAYNLRRNELIFSRLGMLAVLERDFWNVKTKKNNALCSSPGEGSLCRSETKHIRRMALETKLLALFKTLKKQRENPDNWPRFKSR